ncbi:klaroid protein [Anopheles aquasalis]|uniref:klaroid protein n=1 Tax=Anopheles aquasalis TaxID=42839 RepID=UPI00215B08A0|nr:klaroid protein [Anopheles aquasalis]
MSEIQSGGADLRRRSRSMTPNSLNLRVSSDREQNGSDPSPNRKTRKAPTVGTIEEKDESTPTQNRGSSVRKTRIVTSDYSSEETSPETARAAAAAVAANANEQLAKSVAQLTKSSTTTTSTTSSSSVVVVSGEVRAEEKRITVTKVSNNNAASASPKKDTISQQQQQQKVPIISVPVDAQPAAAGKRITSSSSTTSTSTVSSKTVSGGSTIRTSTPKNAVTTRSATAASSAAKIVLTPEELKQHAAYKEYIEAGEYWNKYPKTDYTYSELSPHRREVAPGLIAMPNMSRPSLSNHAERVHTMIQRDPERETYIRERYAAGARFARREAQYDSADEDDYFSQQAHLRQQKRVTIEKRSIVSRFFLAIVTYVFSCYDTVRSVFTRKSDEQQQLYYTRIVDERGFFARVYGAISSFFIHLFKRVYLLISSVLYLDAWLLQTSAVNQEQQLLAAGQRKRRFLLFLLVLLPFLLIGAYLLADEDHTIVLPASSRATIALSSFSRALPEHLRDAKITVEQLYEYVSNSKPVEGFRSASWPSFWTLLPSFGWLSSLSWPTFSTREGTASGPQSSIHDTLRRTLSREEYEELMHHIDSYIDGLLEQKYASKLVQAVRETEEREKGQKQSAITPEITAHVASIIQQSLSTYNYRLTDGDIENVAQRVHQTMLTTYPAVFDAERLLKQTQERIINEGRPEVSKEYIAEIQRIVEQQISITNNQYIIEGHQLEELLTKILSSNQLLTLIDHRIDAKAQTIQTEADQRRNALVESLQKELSDIKAHFNQQLLDSSAQWEDRLQLVAQNHAKLGDQLSAYRLENDKLYQRLLTNIDGRLDAIRAERFEGVNKVVRENILTILGLNLQQDIPEGDLRSWINGVFVAREHLEERLAELLREVKTERQSDIEQGVAQLMADIGEQLRNEMKLRLEEVHLANIKQSDHSGDGQPTEQSAGTLTENDVKRIVREALVIYDADKTGLVDYALETAGGQVLSTRCTENYKSHSAEFRIFGIPIWYPSNTPRTVISPTMEPGQCWAFQGFPGYLVIQLNTRVIVTGFTLEHISKLLVAQGSISSAPRAFTVWGLRVLEDPEPVLLGSYEYRDQAGSSLQYFPVQNKQWQEPLQIVELRIESNHGNIHYTCLYRFRVHGDKVDYAR